MATPHGSGLVGRVLDGRYRIDRHIADGGMASVWLAVDERLERRVAIKVMRDHLTTSEEFVRRFRREARAAAALAHPNAVAVHDQGEDDGLLYLVMEYVDGRTLREIITDEAPLTPRAALDNLIGILGALDAAHTAGLVHRDIKPENVILKTNGTVKVADFGLARAVTTQTATHQTNTLLGTVSYLAPEQVEFGRADERSDVYAAGLLLFEMLTGVKAFDGEIPINVAYQHVHGSVPAPSSKVPSLAQEIDDLVSIATAKDPDERPNNAGEYLQSVRRIRHLLAGEDLDGKPDAATTRALSMSRTSALHLPVSVAASADDALDQDLSASTVAMPPPAPRTQRFTSDGVPLSDESTQLVTDDEEPVRKRRWWRWAIGAVLALALIGGASYGGWWWYTEHGEGSLRSVPALAGRTPADAAAALQAAELGVQTQEDFSETVAKGALISADHAEGERLRKGALVHLVVSKGPERFTIPDLTGKTQDEARALLSQVNLTIGNVAQEWSETVPAGQIIRQDPGPAPAKRDTPVGFVISQGRQPIAVADLTGKPWAAVNKQLTDAGLKVARQPDVFSDTVAAGVVISQDPTNGTKYRGDTVSVTVSKGPDVVKVPSVIGKSVKDAKQILHDAGLGEVGVNDPLGAFFNLVRSQSLEPGSMVKRGTAISLTVV